MALKRRQALESLKEVGYRLTPQRMMILSVIEGGDGHVTAEEIYQKVREEYAFMDIATVYRTLQLLKKLRLVTETDLGGGSTHYELSSEPHHHLVCRECGDTTPLDNDLFEPLRLTLKERFGFEAELEHLPLFGVCAKCSTKRGGARRAAAPAKAGPVA